MIKQVLVCIGFAIFFSTPAFAYLDPGTGSIILQALVGGIVAVSVAFTHLRHQASRFFKNIFKKMMRLRNLVARTK